MSKPGYQQRMINLDNFLGDISVDTFLKDYWNKKPLLIKSACPEASSFATKEDLIEFATDEDFESRIIYEKDQSYTVKDGPITEDDLVGNHTIACHALNLFSEEFKDLENKVTSFIPHWQFDDVMATLSTKGASVGAHTDHYGVFILQAMGSREWFIQENPNQEFKEDLEVKILKQFNPDYSWVLGPGDMIYVPPLCAHHGVTLEESISYSIGFKAFETENILRDYMFDLADNLNDESFYKHETKSDKYELNDEFVDFFQKKLIEQAGNKELFKSWLASNLSSPRYPSEFDTEDELELEVATDTKMIFIKNADESINLYLNGSFKQVTKSEFNSIRNTIDTCKISNELSEETKLFLISSKAII